ncbi:MAG: hypothetical protein Q8M31_04210 [Beijerinckiaceae bacterium]|nr:hypothetical protein [Beijerinckiaceae bacterium]
MRASTLALRAAVIFALCGVGLGIGMAMSKNHLLHNAHAHINLVGWVSLFLFALYYKTNPALDASRVALVQVGSWIFGGALLGLGVTLLYGVGPQYEPFAAIGSLIVFASLLIFTYIIFRPQASSSVRPGAAPAE